MFARFSHSPLVLVALSLCTTFLLTTAITAAPPKGTNVKLNAKVRAPELIAVRIHHDLCPYCSKLTRDPDFSKLGTSIETDVLWVTLDMSSDESQRQSALLIGALGLDEIWPSDLSGLGTITFIDWKEKSVVSSVRAFDAKTIKRAARNSIRSAAR